MRVQGKGQSGSRPNPAAALARLTEAVARGPAPGAVSGRRRATARTVGSGRKRVQSRPGHRPAGSAKRPASAAEPLQFRQRTPGDDEFILQLTESQVSRAHQQAFNQPFSREVFARYLNAGAPVVVVERGKQRIGYYTYVMGPEGMLHINALVIHPAHQSDATGNQVMAQIERQAVALGAQGVQLFVEADNVKAVEFVRRHGFVERYRLGPGAVCFQKVLNSTGGAGAVPGVPSYEWAPPAAGGEQTPVRGGGGAVPGGAQGL
ncbi:MAG: GNAT family N-acetyltransferase [Alicyclobacillus sp.]|nr:GNAT family N-acetyltransferase [Alicyclobacillus sp.]